MLEVLHPPCNSIYTTNQTQISVSCEAYPFPAKQFKRARARLIIGARRGLIITDVMTHTCEYAYARVFVYYNIGWIDIEKAILLVTIALVVLEKYGGGCPVRPDVSDRRLAGPPPRLPHARVPL